MQTKLMLYGNHGTDAQHNSVQFEHLTLFTEHILLYKGPIKPHMYLTNASVRDMITDFTSDMCGSKHVIHIL